MPANDSAAQAAKPDLEITRIFDAPRDLVFRAWLDPKALAQWWGPRVFTNPRCEVDARPGGAIRIDMRAPNGMVFPMGGQFHEIDPPQRLVFTTTAMDGQLENLNTVTFAEEKGKTKMTLRVVVVKATAAVAGALAGMEEGWSQSLDKLEAQVGATEGREITATRLIDAPRDRVFDMWTDPEHIAQWWGPRGFTTTIHNMDVRPGGEWRFVMHGPDGRDYQNHVVYVDIRRPHRLVYDHVSGPRFRSTATFEDEFGKTRLTVRMRFESAALRDQTAREFGAVEGLEQTIERLAERVTGSGPRPS